MPAVSLRSQRSKSFFSDLLPLDLEMFGSWNLAAYSFSSTGMPFYTDPLAGYSLEALLKQKGVVHKQCRWAGKMGVHTMTTMDNSFDDRAHRESRYQATDIVGDLIFL